MIHLGVFTVRAGSTELYAAGRRRVVRHFRKRDGPLTHVVYVRATRIVDCRFMIAAELLATGRGSHIAGQVRGELAELLAAGRGSHIAGQVRGELAELLAAGRGSHIAGQVRGELAEFLAAGCRSAERAALGALLAELLTALARARKRNATRPATVRDAKERARRRRRLPRIVAVNLRGGSDCDIIRPRSTKRPVPPFLLCIFELAEFRPGCSVALVPIPGAEETPPGIKGSSRRAEVVVSADVSDRWEIPFRLVTRTNNVNAVAANRAAYAVLRRFERRPRYSSKGRPILRVTERTTVGRFPVAHALL
jgi:hypothetical protein